ncbi:MAG: DUF3108 domain-containing protein, partial [Deferrisomatales bacterium]
ESEVRFDPAAGVARYFKAGAHQKDLPVPPDVLDPLSCLYAYRLLDLPADQEARLDITDGKKLVSGTVTIRGRERVETPVGTFDTVLIEPRIEGIGGIFRKSPGARILIWVTDDAWRRPVKLESEVVVGAFTAELSRLVHPGVLPPGPR